MFEDLGAQDFCRSLCEFSKTCSDRFDTWVDSVVLSLCLAEPWVCLLFIEFATQVSIVAVNNWKSVPSGMLLIQ